VVTGADAVVAVGDRQRDVVVGAATHEQHRREALAVGDLLEISPHVGVVGRQQLLPARA
jgi:hypothetical protein